MGGLSPTFESPAPSESVDGLRSPPLSSVRGGSRYSAVPASDYDETAALSASRSGRNTPVWLGGRDRSSHFSSATSYGNFNDKSRTNSWAGSAMLGRDYDSVAGLNVPMDKYEDGNWDRRPGEETAAAAHPREDHLEKYGVGKKTSGRKRCIIITIVILAVLIIAVAVAVPVALHFTDDGSSSAGKEKKGTTQTDGSGNGVDGKLLTTGKDGSVVQFGNGSSFVYRNSYGGSWVSDLASDSAQAQTYTKPLSQDWDWATDRIFGVNLGGWLVTEPFIAPSLYEPYENTSFPAVDEYTLSQNWINEGGGGQAGQAHLEQKMRDHYDNFITEQDFADIAGAGLNWVRLPIGFWALETVDGEPFLSKVSWEYVLKAIKWARKYGIRINLDLHAVPGGQNSYNHSGRLNYFGWLNGVMGIVTAQRTLNYIRTLIEFTSQPEIRKVVPLVSVLNEPNVNRGIGLDNIKSFYGEAYNLVRNITGNGAGKGPFIAFHDGFVGVQSFNGFMLNADRVAWDTHPYICFTPPFTDSYDSGVTNVCNQYTTSTDQALTSHGAYIAGEWSLALNDCGLYLNNVGQGARYEGNYPGSTERFGSCQPWDDWANYNQTQKDNMRRFALAQMSSLRNFFFWTWHIGNSARTNDTVNPMWNYKLGLQQGWMPTNINDAVSGVCQSAASTLTSITAPSTTSWSSSFQPWQTGAAANYNVVLGNHTWPPATLETTSGMGTAMMTDPVSNLPSYTATGSILTAPSPTYSASVQGEATPTIGGWFNPNDQAPMFVSVQGCPSLDPYYNGTLPTSFPCTGGNARREVEAAPAPAPTAAPTRVS